MRCSPAVYLLLHPSTLAVSRAFLFYCLWGLHVCVCVWIRRTVTWLLFSRPCNTQRPRLWRSRPEMRTGNHASAWSMNRAFVLVCWCRRKAEDEARNAPQRYIERRRSRAQSAARPLNTGSLSSPTASLPCKPCADLIKCTLSSSTLVLFAFPFFLFFFPCS